MCLSENLKKKKGKEISDKVNKNKQNFYGEEMNSSSIITSTGVIPSGFNYPVCTFQACRFFALIDIEPLYRAARGFG